MSMKLNGCNLISIIKDGLWTSLTFLTYIHKCLTKESNQYFSEMGIQSAFSPGLDTY